MRRRIVFDIETDGLLETCTKIHCFCWYDVDTKESGSFTDYSDIWTFLDVEELVLIGHNIVLFDIPVLKKFLAIDYQYDSRVTIIDTLGLSWVLYPSRHLHGLDEWGQDLGITKPPIDNWKDLPVETYIYRCSEDVKINSKLWDLLKSYLINLYISVSEVNRFIQYITFKLECAREQEELKWKLDVEKCEEYLDTLTKERDLKEEQLADVMPPSKKYKDILKPSKIYKKDESLSEAGKKWLKLLEENNLPEYWNGSIRKEISSEKGNPGSYDQIKDWLFSLGWQPQTFKYVKKKGAPRDEKPRAVPQLSLLDGSDLCPSVKELYSAEPKLEILEGLFILRHRVTILNGFRRDKDDNSFLKARIHGFTNTLRFQHTELVNLPTLMKPYGNIIRGCLIAPDKNHVLCGSDVSGLEEATKHHFMYYYDSKYVEEMRSFGFDPHIDLGLIAGLYTKEEAAWHKWIRAVNEKIYTEEQLQWFYEKIPTSHRILGEEEARKLKSKLAKSRDTAKKGNFAAVYGVGAAKLALTTKLPIDLCAKILKAYWERNWAVKKVAEACTVKVVYGQMWLFNPISKFWYSLRYDKDRFSTLNQGSGVWLFDNWMMIARKKYKLKFCGQFHDENIAPVLKGKEEEHKTALINAMKEVNQILKLNVEVGCSVAFGNSYADIH